MQITNWQRQGIVLLTALLLLFTNLGVTALWDDDEPKNATCAWEMFERNDWLVPTFNGELRTDKPILLYWLLLGAYHVLGVSEFSARFWSAALGTGTVLLTYHIGRKLFNPAAGMWAGIALAGGLMFEAVARAATPDSTLIFCTTLSFWFFVRGMSRQGNFTEGGNDGAVLRPLAWRDALLVYSAMGLAVLAKGPVGFLLPCAVNGCWVLWRWRLAETSGMGGSSPTVVSRAAHTHKTSRWVVLWAGLLSTAMTLAKTFSPLKILRGCLYLKIPLGVAIVLLIALPWYIAVGMETDGRWLVGFLGNHNVNRFLKPMENHRGPIVYYIPAIFVGFFPWSVFLPAGLVSLGKNLRDGRSPRAESLYAACWVGVYVIFFSLARTKLPNYVLPCYPALALIVGRWAEQWRLDPASTGKRLLDFAVAGLVIAGMGLMIALPIVSYFLLPGQAWLGIAGSIPLTMAWGVHRARKQGAASQLLIRFASGGAAFALFLMAFAAPRVSPQQNSQAFAAEIKRHVHSPDHALAIGTFDYSAPSLVYYSRQVVSRPRDAEEVRQFFAQEAEAFLITREDKLPQLREVLPADVDVLSRQRRFLRRGDLVLLGRKPQPIEISPVVKSPTETALRPGDAQPPQ